MHIVFKRGKFPRERKDSRKQKIILPSHKSSLYPPLYLITHFLPILIVRFHPTILSDLIAGYIGKRASTSGFPNLLKYIPYSIPAVLTPPPAPSSPRRPLRAREVIRQLHQLRAHRLVRAHLVASRLRHLRIAHNNAQTGQFSLHNSGPLPISCSSFCESLLG